MQSNRFPDMKPTLSSLFPLPESICRCETYKCLRRYSLTQYNPSIRHKAFWAQHILNARRNGCDNAAGIHRQFSWWKRASNQPPFARCILKGPAREPGRKREMSTIANGTLQLLHTRRVYVCISCFQYWHFKHLASCRTWTRQYCNMTRYMDLCENPFYQVTQLVFECSTQQTWVMLDCIVSFQGLDHKSIEKQSSRLSVFIVQEMMEMCLWWT